MSAVDHFAEAELALSAAQDCETGSDVERYYLAEAQVHATLAVAASQMQALPAEQADSQGSTTAATKN